VAEKRDCVGGDESTSIVDQTSSSQEKSLAVKVASSSPVKSIAETPVTPPSSYPGGLPCLSNSQVTTTTTTSRLLSSKIQQQNQEPKSDCGNNIRAPFVSQSTSYTSNNHFCHPLLIQSQQSFQQQLQPPSINFYESYFDDSYIGDFTGEVDQSRLHDSETLNNLSEVARDWCPDPDLNPSLLEFTYDSFGPESIVFTGSAPNSSEEVAVKGSTTIARESELRPSQQQNKRDIINTQSSIVHSVSLDESESLLMSLSITEPQLTQKLTNCFDNRKIATGYGITCFLKEEDEDNDRELNHIQDKSRGSTNKERISVTQDQVVGDCTLSLEKFKSSENGQEVVESNLGVKSDLNLSDDKISRRQQEQQLSKTTSTSSVMSPEESTLSSIPSSTSSSSVMSCNSPPLSYSSSSASDRDPCSAFTSRNSTLTRSQRKKISPRLNFSQILSVSDDTAKELMSTDYSCANDNDPVKGVQLESEKQGNNLMTGREVILSVADMLHSQHLDNSLNANQNGFLLGPHLHNVLLDSETASSSDASDFLSRVSTPNTEG